MRRFCSAMLALALALATASTQASSNNREPSSSERPSVGRKRGVTDEHANLPVGRVETAWKHVGVVCGAEAFLLRSPSAGPNLDESIQQAIESALADNDGRPVLWIRLEIDLDRLSKMVTELDPNAPELTQDHFAGVAGYKKPRLVPSLVKGHVRTESAGKRLDQSLVFQLPDKTSRLTLKFVDQRQFTLATFSLSRLLLSVDEIFPLVKPIRRGRSLFWITTHARKLGLEPLDPNHLRFFVQPSGIVSEALDIDLTTGELTLYPGTHSKETPRQTFVAPNNLAGLKEVLGSEAFAGIPKENDKVGTDGVSYFIEVNLNGSYCWKLHWSPDDKDFKRIVYQIGATASRRWIRAFEREMGVRPLETNRVRLSTPTADGRYSVIEIDLTTGEITGSRNAVATPSDLAEIKSMLASDAFTRVEESPLPMSADRTAFLIEVNIEGAYRSRRTPVYNLNDYGYRVAQKLHSIP